MLMFMVRLPLSFQLAAAFLGIFLAGSPSRAEAPASPPVLTIDGLGKALAPVDGRWQFHLGDNLAWANPQAQDATGVDGWEQLDCWTTWGAQGHPSYTGFAWYRKHVELDPGGLDLSMLIPKIDDSYEIYWNGILVGRHGAFPPHPVYYHDAGAQTFRLGPLRSGVLALRVWKAPLVSFDPDKLGGLHEAPVIGAPAAISAHKAELDYAWLRGQQFYVVVHSLAGLVMILGLFAWIRHRSQPVLLWIAVFSGAEAGRMILTGLRLPIPYNTALGLLQPCLGLEDVGLWFLLLYLLCLEQDPRLVRWTRILAGVTIASFSLDCVLLLIGWGHSRLNPWLQGADAALTTVFTAVEFYPLVLVVLAVRKRLDLARWMVAASAFLTGMISVVHVGVAQGSRFTHWTLGSRIAAPLFTIHGAVFTADTIAVALLLGSIVYAVYRFMLESGRRQTELEQEFQSARELQQVIIPDRLPQVPGFAITSAYRPICEVGGDFFQILPLEGECAGSTLIVIGDVSGKGLKAAMSVSLIVGSLRALARFTPRPADLLTELNRRLSGRMQGGFATCLALLLGPDGQSVVASAGHLAPFLNLRELTLPGSLPLGIVADTAYEEMELDLRDNDHMVLYTDGLLEARAADGEIFSFGRLNRLFAGRPNAAEATEAGVAFGQDDDITVLTITRVTREEECTTRLTAPELAST
jgi:serine phosphatase RsbU (regulator of sigma subunit)